MFCFVELQNTGEAGASPPKDTKLTRKSSVSVSPILLPQKLKKINKKKSSKKKRKRKSIFDDSSEEKNNDEDYPTLLDYSSLTPLVEPSWDFDKINRDSCWW